jgi:hypothetical protein
MIPLPSTATQSGDNAQEILLMNSPPVIDTGALQVATVDADAGAVKISADPIDRVDTAIRHARVAAFRVALRNTCSANMTTPRPRMNGE